MASEALSVELALRKEPTAVMLTNHQIQMIANTDFVPKGLRGNVPAVFACIARGRAMGIPDMVALNGIVIIEGKATLTSELMEAIVREHGHSITGTVTATEAVLTGRRRDNGDTMEARFDLEMAERAGLLNKANWKKHPDDMMFARAVSKLCRRLFVDCFAGGTYVKEEAESINDDLEVTADEVIDEPAAANPWEATKQRLRDAGVSDQTIADTAHQLFAGRQPSSLTQEEADLIWERAKPEPVQEALIS